MAEERKPEGSRRARQPRDASQPAPARAAAKARGQSGSEPADRDRPVVIEQHFHNSPPVEVRQARSSFIRRHPIAVVAVAVVAGLWLGHGCGGQPSGVPPTPTPTPPPSTTPGTPLPPVTHKVVNVRLRGQVTLQEGQDLTNIDLVNVSQQDVDAAYVTLQVTRDGKPQPFTSVGDCSSGNPTKLLVCPADKVLHVGEDWAMTLAYKAGPGRARIQIRANGGAPNRGRALACDNRGCSLS